MSEGQVVLLAREFLRVTLEVVGPLLLVALVTGLTVSVVQVLTSVQDATLAYVVRLVAVSAFLGLLGRWMLHDVAAYTVRLWRAIPHLTS